MRYKDSEKREGEVLNLVVESYIKESKPVSSGFLCEKFQLPYSTATLRNIMESLEKKGLLSHIHISSGRVPTKEGFRYYVEHLNEGEILKENVSCFDLESSLEVVIDELTDIDEIFSKTLDFLAETSGYTSLLAVSGFEEKFFFRGTRFILEQPEFEDIQRLKTLFYALEVKINEIQELLFNYLDEKIKILIGDEIGFEEISDCSLIISGFHGNELSASLALLGPMRMDYIKAVSTLYNFKQKLRQILTKIL